MIFLILMRIVNFLIDAYITLLFVRMILDWVPMFAPRWRPRGVLWSIIDVVYRLTDPPLRLLRRYIPPLPLGAIYLDMSFIVLYFLLVVLRVLI